jgi:sugar O-acyltransferase (sialic acid O-acetyltransferase NeuD family)
VTDLIGVYGAAGCGRGILPLLREQFPNDLIVFIDDDVAKGRINGHNVLHWQSFLDLPQTAKSVSIAVASPSVRELLAEKCHLANIPLIEARASNVIEMDDVEIGDGACLSPFVTLTSNIRIGRCFHANLYSYVEHDCVIGDFVTLAPAAKVHGNVTIADRAYIGAGAMIRQGVHIGASAVVGMGAVVVKDVPPNTTVVGNPAVALRGKA